MASHPICLRPIFSLADLKLASGVIMTKTAGHQLHNRLVQLIEQV